MTLINSHFKHIFFDMDGTLADTGDGIIESVGYTLKHLGINVNETKMRAFIGPPLKTAFINEYAMSDDEAENAVSIFRKYYAENAVLKVSLFSGVKDTLETLAERGYSLYVATSKPTPFAVKISEYLNISRYFTDIVGSSTDNTRSKKYEVIQYLLDSRKIRNISEVVMVGDRCEDVIGARTVGINTIGVLYGYGTKEELLSEKPLTVINTISELTEILK